MKTRGKTGLKAGILAGVMATSWSCTKNIAPLPDEVSMAPSISLPVGEGSFNLSKTLETLGQPLINITENVPDWAKYTFVYIQDTIALNLNEVYNQSDNITAMELKVNIWNEFPLEGNAQVWLLDESQMPFDSLFTPAPATVPPAEVYSNGNVVGTKFNSFKIKFDNTRIDNLQAATSVVVRAGLKVTEEGINEQNVQYFDRYTLRVQIAARVDFKLNLNN